MDAMQGVRVGLILLLVLLSAMFSGLTLGLMGLDKNNLQCVPAPRPPRAPAPADGGPKPMAGWARPGPAASGPASADGRPTPSPHLAHQPAGC